MEAKLYAFLTSALSGVKKNPSVSHWIEVRMGLRGEESLFFFLPGIEPRFLDPVRNLVITPALMQYAYIS
jgi:hypothetical protein